jgi:predicted enzyme related to lactoylglutathione lyase
MEIQSVKYLLMVQDMERAITFYRDVIGLELRYESQMWSEMAFGNAIIALHGGGSGDIRETGLNIEVADLETACAEVESGGGKVTAGPDDRAGEPIRLARLVDTEGNSFDMAERVR